MKENYYLKSQDPRTHYTRNFNFKIL